LLLIVYMEDLAHIIAYIFCSSNAISPLPEFFRMRNKTARFLHFSIFQLKLRSLVKFYNFISSKANEHAQTDMSLIVDICGTYNEINECLSRAQPAILRYDLL